jgi:transposase
MRCSSDIRKRVIGFVKAGGSKAEAARRFEVSRSSVHNWMCMENGLSFQKPGPKRARCLDREELRRQVEAHNDMTQKERARHFGVSRHCIWYNLQKLRISRKKTDRLQRTQPKETQVLSSSS